MITQERWQSFSKSQQLLMIGSEIIRAKVWQGKDSEKFKFALEQALELLDLSLSDARWKGSFYMLLWLREELAKYYLGQETRDIGILYNAL